MRFVDHDQVAARQAARVCRSAAADYERIATSVGTAVTGVAWWGCERDRVAEQASALCGELRREASSLRATADRLEAAARAAQRRAAAPDWGTS